MIYRLAQAKFDDVAYIASVVASVPNDGLAAARRLLNNFAISRAWVAVRDDVDSPTAVWGAARLERENCAAHYWMLALEPFASMQAEIEELSRLVVGEMLGEFRMLENFVEADAVATVRLMERIGFTVEPPKRHPGGEILQHIWIAR